MGQSVVEGKKDRFLTLATTEINGWVMASCPEFEVSACGPNRDGVVEDLHSMIKGNATIFVSDKAKGSSQLVKWSEMIVGQEDISVFFKIQD